MGALTCFLALPFFFVLLFKFRYKLLIYAPFFIRRADFFLSCVQKVLTLVLATLFKIMFFVKEFKNDKLFLHEIK